MRREGSDKVRMPACVTLAAGFECSEIQSDLMQEIQFGCGERISPANLCNLPMTGLKNLCTFALRVCGTHCGFPSRRCNCAWVGFSAGPFPARQCFLILSGSPSIRRRPFFLRQGVTFNLEINLLLIAPLGAVSIPLSVYETAHPNIHHNTQRQKHKQH
jgi:hypothetical protein